MVCGKRRRFVSGLLGVLFAMALLAVAAFLVHLVRWDDMSYRTNFNHSLLFPPQSWVRDRGFTTQIQIKAYEQWSRDRLWSFWDRSGLTENNGFQFGRSLLQFGHQREAIEVFNRNWSAVEADSDLLAEAHFLRGLAALRLAEVENCLAHISHIQVEKKKYCIYPIGRDGIHERKDWTAVAAREFETSYNLDSSRVLYRWFSDLTARLNGGGGVIRVCGEPASCGPL